MLSWVTDIAVVHIPVVSIGFHRISIYSFTIAPLNGKNVLMYGIIWNKVDLYSSIQNKNTNTESFLPAMISQW